MVAPLKDKIEKGLDTKEDSRENQFHSAAGGKKLADGYEAFKTKPFTATVLSLFKFCSRHKSRLDVSTWMFRFCFG